MRKMVSAPCRLCSPTLPGARKRACLKERAVQEATWFNGRCGVRRTRWVAIARLAGVGSTVGIVHKGTGAP
jgi:hypothetical protein